MLTQWITGALVAGMLIANDVPVLPSVTSGPQVGQRNNRSGFFPQHVAGPFTGERRCPV